VSNQNENAAPEPAGAPPPSTDPPPATLPPGPDRIVKRGEPPVDFRSLLRKSGDGGDGEK
jgi:hypothetical protein